MNADVAVITGASSGIGRATAIELARGGMHVVLAARSKKALQDVAEECESYGIEALVVVTDVTSEKDMQKLAAKTIDRFGGFSVWINNAGVTALGSADTIPAETYRRVMDTNYFGCVYGTKAAMRQFKIQQEGTLINVASVLGTIPLAYESPYVASKFAVEGFTASVREEIAIEAYPDIHICTVLPASINSPIYRNAANYTGKHVVPIKPIYATAHAAATITGLVTHPRPKAVVGMAGYGLQVAKAMLPTALFEKTFAQYSETHHFTDEPAPQTDGNLAKPSSVTAISGGWTPHTPIPKSVIILGTGLVAGLICAVIARRAVHNESEA